MASSHAQAATRAFSQSYCSLIVIILCVLVVITPSAQKHLLTINNEQSDLIAQPDISNLFLPASAEIDQEVLSSIILVLKSHDLVAQISLFADSVGSRELVYARALALAGRLAEESIGPEIAQIVIEPAHSHRSVRMSLKREARSKL